MRQAEESTFTPTVDVYLPVCKEPIGLLANTWKFVKELEYPHVTVHVLDDGAKDDVRDLSIEFGFRCEPYAEVVYGKSGLGRCVSVCVPS